MDVIKNLFTTNQSFATSLIILMLDEYGTELLEWNPNTILIEIEDTFHVSPSTRNFDLLMSAISLLLNDGFYSSVPTFNDLCNTLSGELMHPEFTIPTDAAGCAWGITEAMLISPPEHTDTAFTEEIRAYISEILKAEGILNPPDILKIAKLDKKIAEKVNFDYSDDPDLFAGIYQVQDSRTQEINNFVSNRLYDLTMQLKSLPLKNGKVEDIADKMLRSLDITSQASSILP